MEIIIGVRMGFLKEKFKLGLDRRVIEIKFRWVISDAGRGTL